MSKPTNSVLRVVGEAVHERLDRRVDQVQADRGQGRQQVEVGLDPVLPLPGQQLGELVEQVVEDDRADHAGDDGDQRVEDLDGHGEPPVSAGGKTGTGPGCRAVAPPGTPASAGSGRPAVLDVVQRRRGRPVPPLIQAIISRQKEPEPTSPGIWSEPSNTKSVDS